MKNQRRNRIWLLAVLITGFLTAGLHAQPARADDVAELLLPLGNGGTVSLPPQAAQGMARSGRLNTTVFGSARIRLTLPDDTVIVAHRDREARGNNGSVTWLGEFDGAPGSLMVLTALGGAVTGYLNLGSKVYELMPGSAGSHALYEVDVARLPPDAHRYAEATVASAGAVAGDVAADILADSGSTATVTATAGGGTGLVHDLLIVYTPASRARYGQASLESMLVSAVQAANQAYQNSQVNITLNLVGMREIAYTETGDMGTALSRLRIKGDGYLDGVHTLRDEFGADLVSLVDEDQNYCGVAYVQMPEDPGFAVMAFNVVNSICLSNQTLAHEIGHNQGNSHDRSTAGGGAFPYSYGYRRCTTDGTAFGTVMAYTSGCTGVSRVNYFSNPNILYNGYPMGVDYALDPTRAADNARSMNNTADTVAGFSAGPVTAPPADPSSLSAAATSASQIKASWVDNATNESGFKVERSSDGVVFSEIATLASNSTSYSDSGLASGKWYWYRVRDYNSVGNSGYSNVSSAATPASPPASPPPSAPTGLAATPQPKTKIYLGWTDTSTAETGFGIERSTDQQSWSQVATVGANVTTYVASGLRNGTTYYFRVRATNAAGPSGWSNTASARARR